MMTIGKDIQVMDLVEGVAQAATTLNPFTNILRIAVQSVQGNVMQRRRENWESLVGERLSKLEEAVFNELGDNESFATALIRATELAAQTNTIKAKYLANAVGYTAEHTIDEDTLILLFNAISKYTVSHCIILRYLSNPEEYFQGDNNMMAGSVFHFFDKTYPNIDKSRRNLIVSELQRDGLVQSFVDGTMTSSGMAAKRTTDLGDLFLSFYGIRREDYE